MKKRRSTTPPATQSNQNRPSPIRPESSAPARHPATGQVLSEVKDKRPGLPKQPRKKAKVKKRKLTVTIAPGVRSTRDVSIHQPRQSGNSFTDVHST